MSGKDSLAYLQVVKKRAWVILLLMAVTVGTILIVFITARSVYTASVRFLVTTPPPSVVSVYEFRDSYLREEIAYARANFIELLRTREVSWRTIEDLGISMPGDELQRRIEVEPLEGSEFIQLTVTADSAEEAQLLANGLVDNAVRYYGKLQAAPATISLNFINRQLEGTLEELNAAEQDLLQFQVEHHIGELDSTVNSLQTLLRSLLLERDVAEATGQTSTATAYDRIIAQREQELEELLQLGAQYTELQSAVNRAQSLYNLLLDKQAEAKLKEHEALNAGYVQVVEPARKPGHPDSPFNGKLLAIGAVASLIVGLLLVFLLEYIERLRVFVPTEEVQGGVSS